MKKIINIGIMAHVDAGKTSLSEAMFSIANPTYSTGNIKQGTTLTDTLQLERERGITIKTGAISFIWKNTKINLLDMPGHTDFFGEVERSLNAIDIAVLVISGLEKLNNHTRKLFDLLKKIKKPVILFINKIDMENELSEVVLEDIKTKLTSDLIEFTTLNSIGTQEKIIETNDVLLSRYLDNVDISNKEILLQMKKSVLSQNLFPVFKGSAIKKLEVKNLLDLLDILANEKEDSEKSNGYVYKIDYNSGSKQTYIKINKGNVFNKETIFFNNQKNIKLSNLYVLDSVGFNHKNSVQGPDIIMIKGDNDLSINDHFGTDDFPIHSLFQPTLKTIFNIDDSERNELLNILSILNTEDPLLNLNIDINTHKISMMIFGQVQIEYLESVILEYYPFVSLQISRPLVQYKETIQSTSIAKMTMMEHPNPYWATMQVKVEPSGNSENSYHCLVSKGYLKKSFQNAIKESVEKIFIDGLYGYEFIGLKVTLIDAEFASPVSTPSDFRKLTPYVLFKALLKANINIVEPIIKFSICSPKNNISLFLSEIKKFNGQLLSTTDDSDEIIMTAELNQTDFLEFEKQLNQSFGSDYYLTTAISGFNQVSKIPNQLVNTDYIKNYLIKNNS